VLETAVEPGGPAALATDAALLGRALEALVRSAAAAGARRVELRVTGGPLEGNPAGRVVFLVADDGEAVPPSDLPRLLVPFAVSSARTRRPHGGSGLGLALAAALVRALGGELEAAGPANGDRGLTLRLSLPP
jgi:signal transduction histidine kinase